MYLKDRGGIEFCWTANKKNKNLNRSHDSPEAGLPFGIPDVTIVCLSRSEVFSKRHAYSVAEFDCVDYTSKPFVET